MLIQEIVPPYEEIVQPLKGRKSLPVKSKIPKITNKTSLKRCQGNVM